MKRIAILLSGRGSNFIAIADQVASGVIAAEIVAVVSNRSGAPGLQEAIRRGLPAHCLPSKGLAREDYDRELQSLLEPLNLDLLCLAGYMRLLSPAFIAAFRGRLLNIHPSLLPAFPGLHAQRQALEHGVKIAGCTVHFVDEDLDAGPIILQAAVPVLDSDGEISLSERILQQEHKLYSDAIRLILAGNYRLAGRRVISS